MTNKLNYITLALTLCMLLTACKEEVIYIIQNPETPEVGEKTPIVLSVGGVDGNQGVATRASGSAVITKDESSMIPFPYDTNVFMIMQSEYDENHEDFDDPDNTATEGQPHTHKKKTTIARGTVAANQTAVSFDTNNQRYWDDAHARSSQLTIWAYAQMYKPTWTQCTFQRVTNESAEGWAKFEDAQYNTSTIYYESVYGWNQDNVYPGIKYWNVTHNTNGVQDGTSIRCQDLLFSNNIADNREYPADADTKIGDKRLKFDFTSRKFPGNPQLYFRHAMSKITIHIIEGDGFVKTGTGANDDFKFTPNNSNVKLKGFNTKGAFNIKEGEFQWLWPEPTYTNPAPADIPQIYCWATPASGDAYTLEALAIPNITPFLKSQSESLSNPYSRFVSGKKNLSTDVMMEFSIDGNKYQITSDALFHALMNHDGSGNATTAVTNANKVTDANGDYIPLEAGKNYVFTFKVSKTKISGITAQVVDWETVTAEEQNPSNARVTLALDGRGDAKGIDVAFYRALNESSTIDDTYTSYDWTKTYEKSTSAEYQTSQWKTEWYWPNNKSFYHFRAISPAPSSNLTNDATNGDYFTLASADATSSSYNEIAWGAPFYNKEGTSNTKFSYSTTKGFDGTGAEAAAEASRTHQIHKAIGPTDSQIKLLMFHMMSGVHFTIITSDGSKNDQVELYKSGATNERPKVQLVGYLPTGKVYMGDGHVDPDGTKTTTSVGGITCQSSATEQYGQQDYYYSAIPQDLAGVKLYITTPDNNQYIVDLKDVKVSSDNITSNNLANPYIQGSDSKFVIDRWYPGFKYEYKLKLTKKGIDNITATIVNWETVTAADDKVQIQ